MERIISKKLITAAVAGAFVVCSGVAMAGTVGAMNTFTAGSPAVAADVNANFSEQTAQINDNAGSISTMQTMAVSDFTATVDCSSQTITDVINSQPKWGSLTVTITGTCNENLSISRSNLTLSGGTITAASSTAPTIEILGQQDISLQGVTVTGGDFGIFAKNEASLVLNNVTTSGNTTSGLWLQSSSAVVEGTGASFDGIIVVGGSAFQMTAGTTTINAGGTTLAVIAHDHSSIYLGSGTGAGGALAVNGDVELMRSLMHIDGTGTPTITGTVNVLDHSSLALNGGTLSLANVLLSRFGYFKLDGTTLTLSGTLTVEHMSILDAVGGTNSVGSCTYDITSEELGGYTLCTGI